MDWRIEATKPVSATEIQATLEADRDRWISTVPQVEPDAELDELDKNLADSHNEKRAPWTTARAKYIKAKSATLGPSHTEIKRQMDDGIAAAVALSRSQKGKFRASVTGHFKPGHEASLDERLSVSIDTCRG